MRRQVALPVKLTETHRRRYRLIFGIGKIEPRIFYSMSSDITS